MRSLNFRPGGRGPFVPNLQRVGGAGNLSQRIKGPSAEKVQACSYPCLPDKQEGPPLAGPASQLPRADPRWQISSLLLGGSIRSHPVEVTKYVKSSQSEVVLVTGEVWLVEGGKSFWHSINSRIERLRGALRALSVLSSFTSRQYWLTAATAGLPAAVWKWAKISWLQLNSPCDYCVRATGLEWVPRGHSNKTRSASELSRWGQKNTQSRDAKRLRDGNKGKERRGSRLREKSESQSGTENGTDINTHEKRRVH